MARDLLQPDDFWDTRLRRISERITRLTDDVSEKLSWFACSGIFRTYEALLQVTFILAMMLTIDPVLTLWTAGPLPLLILIFFFTSSILEKRYDVLQASISKFNDVMEACFSGIRVVKAYVRENVQKKKFADTAMERRNAEIISVKATTVVDSLYGYIWQLGVVIVLLAGGYKVLYSDLTLGGMATFIYYVVWLVFPMFDIGQFLVKSRQSAVSINRLLELENVPAMIEDNGTKIIGPDVKAQLSFESVHFAFPDSRNPILNNINFEINAGQTVALVGRVGSGKTWLINLVPRLVDPTEGSVKLDGRDLREYKLEELRRIVGYVPQEPALFSDSVKNNITFGRQGISDTLLEWAIDISQLKDDIASFPDGIDTAIGTRGMAISGGQKQRLALARALVGKPRILILDDCTSALDSATEAALWERLNQVMPDMTAMLITHRPDTLQSVDMIYVFENGRIIETGKHDKLMVSGSEYAKIYRRYELEEQVSA
ncbi:MAG: ABC transporter ATP-binding protein [candidate division Zixibacteria bacterium]|nr:ABC transporter ATP-binding protein [candidate division Zixibacteria bacterium]